MEIRWIQRGNEPLKQENISVRKLGCFLGLMVCGEAIGWGAPPLRLGAFLAGKALEEWGAVWRGKTPKRLGCRLAGQSPEKTAPCIRAQKRFDELRRSLSKRALSPSAARGAGSHCKQNSSKMLANFISFHLLG